MATYTYSVSGDITAGSVNRPALQIEIEQGLTEEIDEIEVNGDVLTIEFSSALSGGDQTSLDAIVLAHGGAGQLPWGEIEQTINVSSGTAAIGIEPDGTAVFQSCDDTGKDVVHEQVGTNGSAYIQLRKSLGTKSARTAPTSGTKIAGVCAAPWDGSTFRDHSQVAFYATEDQSPTELGSEIRIETTPNGSQTRATRITVQEDGDTSFNSNQVKDVADPTADQDAATKAYVDTFAKPRVFDYDADVDVTQSTSFQTKMTTASVTLEAGTYEVCHGYGWSIDATDRDFEGRLQQQVDGGGYSDIGEIHLQEGKDSGGSFGSTGTNQRLGFFRRYQLVVSSSASYQWRLQWRSTDSSDQASMWEAHIKVQRTA